MKKPYLPEKDHAAIPQFIEDVRRNPPDWTLLRAVTGHRRTSPLLSLPQGSRLRKEESCGVSDTVKVLDRLAESEKYTVPISISGTQDTGHDPCERSHVYQLRLGANP
jgi:hypothetical protein